MQGVSFAFTFDDAKAPSRHTQQYFEILGNRAMYKDGWLACWRLDRIPWKIDPETLARFAPGKWNPDQDKCELYNLDEDFSQADNVADEYPDKVRELTALFWSEAEKYQVLPLLGEMAAVWGFPKGLPDQRKFIYENGTENISSGMIPPIYNRSYSISADLDNPGRSGLGLRPGIAGVIVAESSFLGGFSLYVENGYLKHTYSLLGLKLDTISSHDSVPPEKSMCATSSPPINPASSAPVAQAGYSSTANNKPKRKWNIACRSGSPRTKAWTSAPTTVFQSCQNSNTPKSCRNNSGARSKK